MNLAIGEILAILIVRREWERAMQLLGPTVSRERAVTLRTRSFGHNTSPGPQSCYRVGLATATLVVGLISTRYAWYVTLPRFSTECNGWLVGSNVTCISLSSARGVFFPSGARRWDRGSRQYTTTAGHVCVCHGSFSPGGMWTLRTRTCAFSRTTEILGSWIVTASVAGSSVAA